MTLIPPAASATSRASRPPKLGEPGSDRAPHIATIDCADIKAAVCAHFNLPIRTMTSKERERCIARPRQVGMYLARHLTGISYYRIGRRFGWRDHSTVLDAVRNIERLRSEVPAIDDAVREIEQRLIGGLA